MSALLSPIHVGQVGGRALRFFASPLAGPDFPWHSVDDLYVALGFPRPLRRELKAKLQREWAANIRTVATACGITTTAPHLLAQGLLDAADEVGCAPLTASDDYAAAVAEAFNVATRHMRAEDRVACAMAAFHAGGGL